jgi:hypothetical protein
MHWGATLSPAPAVNGKTASKGCPTDDLTRSSPIDKAHTPPLIARAPNAVSHLLMDKYKTILTGSWPLSQVPPFPSKNAGRE